MIDEETLKEELLKQMPKNVQGPSFLSMLTDIDNIKLEAIEARTKADALEPNTGFSNPYSALAEVNAKYSRLNPVESTRFICPSCGRQDQGNLMNKKPWCPYCNTSLVHKDKVEKWMKNSIKPAKRSLHTFGEM